MASGKQGDASSAHDAQVQETGPKLKVGSGAGDSMTMSAADTAVAMAVDAEREAKREDGHADTLAPGTRSSMASSHGDPSASSSLARMVGTTIAGRYQITRQIGQGGMGAVFEAIHTQMQRPVAIKVLLDKFARREAIVARLEQEARLAGTIRNEHIIEIFDIGTTDDGRTFVAMEYLEGESLAELIAREGKLGELRVLQIASQIASALSAAHAAGVVHRDVKPENVFMLQRKNADFVKVVDFGISKSLRSTGESDEENVRLTQTGMVLGTPLYMSPEQARGDEALDQRIDVYALGVIMYEASTGKVPFTGPNYLSVISQVLSEGPKSPRAVVPGLSEDFDAIVLRAMAKDRDDRYPTCEALLEDIQAVIGTPSASGERARISGIRGPAAAVAKPRTRWVLYAGILATAAGGVALAVKLLMPDEAAPKPAPVAAVVPIDAAPPLTVIDAAPAPTVVEILIRSTPPGATVYAGDRSYATEADGLVHFRAALNKGPIQLTAELPGYHDASFEVDPSIDRGTSTSPIPVRLEKVTKGQVRKVKRPPVPPTGSGTTPTGRDPKTGGDISTNPYP